MNTACAALWGSVIAAGAICLVVAGQRAALAATRLSIAEHELAATVELTRELSTLRAAATPSSAASSRPGALQPRIAAALQSSALPATALSSVTPEAEMTVAGPDGKPLARRRRATLVLQGLTLPGVGKFLAAWRSLEPAWVIASIDLSPSGSSPAGGDLPLRAALVLEMVAIDQESGPSALPPANLLGAAH